MTIKGSDGKPIQVSQAMVAQAQMGLVQPSADGTVTLPGPNGMPVKIPQAALATAAATVIPNLTTGKQHYLTAYKTRYKFSKNCYQNMKFSLIFLPQNVYNTYRL